MLVKDTKPSNVAPIVSVDESVYYVSGFLNYVPHHKHLSLRNTFNTPSTVLVSTLTRSLLTKLIKTLVQSLHRYPSGKHYWTQLTRLTTTTLQATRYRQILNIAKRTFSNTDVIEAEGNTRFVELFRINRGEVSSNYDSIYPNDTFRTRPTHQKKQIDPLLVSTHQSRGTQGFTNTSVQSTITGKGTAFLTDFAVGDKIYLEKDQYYGNGTVSFNGSGFITGQNTTFSNDFSR